MTSPDSGTSGLADCTREILGYLNFSSGKPDPGFQSNVNRLCEAIGSDRDALGEHLLRHLGRLHQDSSTFADKDQAESVVRLVFDRCFPAYREHHADLLAHVDRQTFQQPFFWARMFEAVLAQGGPWEEHGRVVDGALGQLNDFLGYRPLAVLENGRQMQPYPHERYRPVPLFIQGAGVADGKYHDLIHHTITFLKTVPEDLRERSFLDLSAMEELAMDVRAHDHMHPVNKRTNYMFGEWDPHQIDNKGRFRRFVIRQIILDGLLRWMAQAEADGLAREESLFDAAAVLGGTMLMASSVSGSGPGTHSSDVTLSSLLPMIARQRDEYYDRVLASCQGGRAARLQRESQNTQQPFGHVRQALNIELSRYGARQVQFRHVALQYARIGFPDAARQQSARIPAASTRFETEIQWRVSSVNNHLERGETGDACRLIQESVDLLHRGIDCGAIADPWNILGFQGLFPLFSNREDTVPDQRVEVLLDLMEQLFEAFSRGTGESAAQGNQKVLHELRERFRTVAEFWDQFASTTVEDLPHVSGEEHFESAQHVAESLVQWRAAGQASGDISFWREHVDRFHSAKAYAEVVEALLQKKDHVAAMGLLMQWLSVADQVGLESGQHTIHSLLLRWLELATGAGLPAGETWPAVRRLFDFLEANAGDYWDVPLFEEAADRAAQSPEDDNFWADDLDEWDEVEEDEEDDDGGLFDAAYDGVTYHDSAEDGTIGDTLDEGYAPGQTEFEAIYRTLEPRLRFLKTLAELWQMAALRCYPQPGGEPVSPEDLEQRRQTFAAWHRHVRGLQRELVRLLQAVWEYDIAAPTGDHDSNVEYYIQLQTKFDLLHNIVITFASFRGAVRCLRSLAPKDPDYKESADERLILSVYRSLLAGDASAVQQQLPQLLTRLAKRPLLYVPFMNGGQPKQILAAKSLQSVLKFLLLNLPKLGLLRETWHVLQTAYKMERTSRPQGQSVTEFDRLFKDALGGTLDAVIESAPRWRLVQGRTAPSGVRRPSAAARVERKRRESRNRPADQPPSGRWFRSKAADRLTDCRYRVPTRRRRLRDRVLVQTVGSIVERYLELWIKHSSSMQLSPVEALRHSKVRKETQQFIERYGADLFHASMLTFGNVRTILHDGVEGFLEYMSEFGDPLHPVRLIEDLDDAKIDFDDAVEQLQLLYGIIADQYERFVEYNTTTTHSDYGERFFCLLDFLRTEAAYQRDAWNLAPMYIGHERLTTGGRPVAAHIWERMLKRRTAPVARKHLKKLAQQEKKYAMRLPGVTDLLNERFVKPLAVNRILALVPRCIRDARQGRRTSDGFATLKNEIESYLADSTGSAIDVPEWLRALEQEVDRALLRLPLTLSDNPQPLHHPTQRLPLKRIRQQLRAWNEPLSRRKKPGT